MSAASLLEIHSPYIERFDQFNARYFGFGKGLFVELHNRLESHNLNIKFYHGSVAVEDAFVLLYKNGTEIAIQLDPLIEKIILWDQETRIELGDWYDNHVELALFAINHWDEMKASDWKRMPW